MDSQQDSEQLPQIHTAGGAAITGDVNTGGGDFVGRDFIQHIKEHVTITGDGNVMGDGNTVIRQEGGDYAIQIGQLNVTLPLEDLRGILDPRYEHESGRRDFYKHAPRLELERYVNRPHEYDQIKTLLLSDATAVGITTALRGAGGFGKTTLARILCDDAEVQARFSDGILWATLGENPDVLARLRDWVTALGGIISEDAPTIPQLVNRLTDLLRDGAYLLLIDDVWDSTALTRFLCGGPRCAHLATTRNRDTLPADAQAVVVDTMRPAEAVALLGYGVAADVPETAALHALARRLGHWPLLLGIINSILREMCEQGASLADALAYVTEGLAEEGLTVFDVVDAADRARAVGATLEVSLKRLAPTDRARYTELAIFSEDTDIPAAAAAQLWRQTGGLSVFKTKHLFRRLGSASLVQSYNAEHQTVRLHDVVRVYLISVLGPEGCADAHRALLTGYRGMQNGDGWHTAPDDGYLYAHLAYHLDALAATDDSAAAELATLFATDDWLQVRVAVDDYTYDGYLADLEYAWRRAEETTRRQITEGVPPDVLIECLRYALIRTTVNSMADNYSPELVARAVEVGLWSPARALSVAAKVPDPEQRAKTHTLLLELDILTAEQRETVQRGGLAAVRAIENERDRAQALAALASYLNGDLLASGLTVARTIENEWERARALAALAPQLTGIAYEQVLAEGLTAARAIQDTRDRTQALATLTLQLTEVSREPILAEGLMTARTIWDEGRKSEALLALAPQLTGALLTEALAMAQAIGNEVYRAQVLAKLASQLKGTLLMEGLAAAQAIKNKVYRVQVLVALGPQLEDAVREQVLAEELASIRAIMEEWERAAVLIALAPQLTWALLEKALAITDTIENKMYRVQVIAAIAPQLTETLRNQILAKELESVRVIKEEWERASALAVLAPHLAGSLLLDGLIAARAIQDGQALAAFYPQLSRVSLLEELTATRVIQDGDVQAQALATLAQQLVGEAREQVLVEGFKIVRAIREEWRQIEALAALAPQLSGDLLAEELTAVRAVGDEKHRASVLVALAPHLTGDLLAEGVDAAWMIKDEEHWATVLVALAPKLTEGLLMEGLKRARLIMNEKHRASVLVALAPHLTGDLLAEGLAAARAIEDEEHRATALVALAPHLTRDLLKEGLKRARLIKNEEHRATVLVALAPHLTGDLLADGLAAARAIEDEGSRVRALVALDSHALADMLSAARRLENQAYRAQALALLASYVTSEVREQALTEELVKELVLTRMIEDERIQAQILITLAPQLTEKALVEGLITARTIKDKVYRAQALAALTSHLADEAREQELAKELLIAQTVTEGGEQAQVLTALAPQLTGELLDEGLMIAHSIYDEYYQAYVLAMLPRRLVRVSRTETTALSPARMSEDLKYRAGQQLHQCPCFAGLATPSEKAKHQMSVLLTLCSANYAKREEVLRLLADKDDFKPDLLGLTPEAIARIAEAVIDVCRRWDWV